MFVRGIFFSDTAGGFAKSWGAESHKDPIIGDVIFGEGILYSPDKHSPDLNPDRRPVLRPKQRCGRHHGNVFMILPSMILPFHSIPPLASSARIWQNHGWQNHKEPIIGDVVCGEGFLHSPDNIPLTQIRTSSRPAPQTAAPVAESSWKCLYDPALHGLLLFYTIWLGDRSRFRRKERWR